MSRPGTVTAAFVMWIIASVSRIVIGITTFFGGGDQGILLGILLGAATIVFGIIMLLIVVQMKNGRSWARLVLTILGVLGIAADVLEAIAGRGFSGFSLAFTAVAVVLMYVGGANAYFARRR